MGTPKHVKIGYLKKKSCGIESLDNRECLSLVRKTALHKLDALQLIMRGRILFDPLS